jgi:hypothetical protein
VLGLATLIVNTAHAQEATKTRAGGTKVDSPIHSQGIIDVKAYGAKGDNKTDDYQAIVTAFTRASSSGKALYFPQGKYLVNSQLVFPLDSAKSGVRIFGAGVTLSVINARNVPDSPQVSFSCQGASPTKACHTAYLTVENIGFETQTPHTGVAFGNMDLAKADNINALKLDAWVYNYDTSESAKAVTLNRLFNPDVRLIANVKGDGTALTLRQVSFGRFFGSFGAGVYRREFPSGDFMYTKGVAVRITDSFNNGNVFTAMDMENVAICVVHDSPANQGNTFVGGTFSFKDYGVVSTAGSRLMIQNPGINPTQASVTHMIHPSKDRGLFVLPPL